jgi:hypothetical protein
MEKSSCSTGSASMPLLRTCAGVIQDQGTACAELVKPGTFEPTGVERQRQLVDHMTQAQPPLRQAGQLDGLGEAAIGGRTAVDGNKDALVHEVLLQ